MARAKRKTVAQQVVATAGIGLPAPVRQVAASRWGAPLAIAIVLGLIGTGVATVDWDGWMPHLKINKERAQEVRQSIRQGKARRAETRAQADGKAGQRSPGRSEADRRTDFQGPGALISVPRRQR